MSDTHLSLEEVEALARGCLTANGCDQANAETVAATVTAAERDGAASHGLFRIPGYVAALRSGKVNGRAKPKAGFWRRPPSGSTATAVSRRSPTG